MKEQWSVTLSAINAVVNIVLLAVNSGITGEREKESDINFKINILKDNQ